MTASEKRIIIPLLERCRAYLDTIGVNGGLQETLASMVARYSKKPRPSPRKAEKRKRKLSLKAETAAIREAVFRRADGGCEACSCTLGLEVDHWLGGSGRRTQRQSMENCWVLCRYCHRDRTANEPSAAAWNDIFKEHCRKHIYPFTPHKEIT